MNTLDLRPLSTAEILDRTFTLYRRHFLFFVGLAAIPRLPGLLFSLLQVQWIGTAGFAATASLTVMTYILAILGYLYSQGAATVGVSEFYLGRSTTLVDSLKQVTNHLGRLFGVAVLSVLTLIAGFVLLIVPGVIAACRLMVCVPAVVVENRGVSDSYSRSWELTKGYAVRAFLIMLLYFVLSIGFSSIASIPLVLGVLRSGSTKVEEMRGLVAMQTVISAALEALLTPILLIATAVYYYDLRVRKEALDLQLMMPNDPAPVSEGQ